MASWRVVCGRARRARRAFVEARRGRLKGVVIIVIRGIQIIARRASSGPAPHLKQYRQLLAADHDLHDHVPVVVAPARHELERLRGVREREAVRDDLLDVRQLARGEQRERGRVRVRVPERAEDVHLARRCGGDRQRHVPRAHPDEHDLSAGHCGL